MAKGNTERTKIGKPTKKVQGIAFHPSRWLFPLVGGNMAQCRRLLPLKAKERKCHSDFLFFFFLGVVLLRGNWCESDLMKNSNKTCHPLPAQLPAMDVEARTYSILLAQRPLEGMEPHAAGLCQEIHFKESKWQVALKQIILFLPGLISALAKGGATLTATDGNRPDINK